MLDSKESKKSRARARSRAAAPSGRRHMPLGSVSRDLAA